MSEPQTPLAPVLEYAFSVKLQFTDRIETPALSVGTRRGSLTITGGTLEGPGIRAVVLPGGGDSPVVRPDGVVLLDARYLARTDDGVHIAVTNRGIRRAPADVVARLTTNEDAVDPTEYYLRTSPVFEVEPGRYDWLAQHLFVGVGRRVVRGNVIDYFKVH